MATTCKLIAKNVLGSDAASTSFTSIPGTFDDLYLVVSVRTAHAGIDALYLQFNGDTNTGNYSGRRLVGDGASASSSTTAAVVFANGSITTGNSFASGEAYIPNYAGSTNKSASITSMQETNATTAYGGAAALLWSNTAAITSATLVSANGDNLKAGSSFYLYGITKA